MAEDLRSADPGHRNLTIRRVIEEARRQEESCLYTSTAMFIWLSRIRWQQRFFVGAPVVMGAVAGAGALQATLPPLVVAILALGASLFPALADALKVQTGVDEVAKAAAEFKALQDRFRRLALVTAVSHPEKVEEQLGELMDRMDIARSGSLTVPEWAFVKAKKKIDAGHYSFAVDVAE